MNSSDLKRVIAYVDGFNLYHAINALNQSRLKWLNLWSLLDSITRGDETLISVKYFSAYATWRPGPYFRHRHYVKALEELGIEAIMGNFKKSTVKCKSCSSEWPRHEEKETDVNLALEVVIDCFEDNFDRAIIVSADSDMLPAIRKCKEKFPQKEIFVVTPPGRHEIAHDLRSATGSFNITKSRLKKHILPDTVRLKKKNDYEIAKCPPEYK